MARLIAFLPEHYAFHPLTICVLTFGLSMEVVGHVLRSDSGLRMDPSIFSSGVYDRRKHLLVENGRRQRRAPFLPVSAFEVVTSASDRMSEIAAMMIGLAVVV